MSDMGPPDDTPRRAYRLQSNTAANSGMGPLSANLFGLDLPSPFGPDKGQMGFPDLFGNFADTPSNLIHFDPLSVKNNSVSHSSGGSSVGPDSRRARGGGVIVGDRFDFDDAVAKNFPSPRAGEEVKGGSPFRWSTGSAHSAPGGIFSFPDGTFPAATAGNSFSGSGDGNPLDCMADAAVLEDHVKQEVYEKKFKRRFGRSDPDSTSTSLGGGIAGGEAAVVVEGGGEEKSSGEASQQPMKVL